MTVKIDYHAIRNLGYAMMADIWAMLAEHLMILLEAWSDSSELFTYLSLTFQLFQIVFHVEILASLFRLKGLNADYDKARRRYAVTVVTTALIMALMGLTSLVSRSSPGISQVILVAAYPFKIIVEAAGGMTALRGTANLTDSFGLEQRATKNRRASVVMMIASVFLAVALGGFCLLLFLAYFGAVTQAGRFWIVLLILSVVAGFVFWVTSRFLAAGGMCRSYKEIRELTQ